MIMKMSSKKAIMNNIRFPSMFPKGKPIPHNKGMSQKEFLRRTIGNPTARFSNFDGSGIIAGVDCYPFNKRRHDDGSFDTKVEAEYEQAKQEEKLRKEEAKTKEEADKKAGKTGAEFDEEDMDKEPELKTYNRADDINWKKLHSKIKDYDEFEENKYYENDEMPEPHLNKEQSEIYAKAKKKAEYYEQGYLKRTFDKPYWKKLEDVRHRALREGFGDTAYLERVTHSDLPKEEKIRIWKRELAKHKEFERKKQIKEQLDLRTKKTRKSVV